MDFYYKFYESYRFRNIANEKLRIQNKSLKRIYYITLISSLLLILLLPFLQYIHPFVHNININEEFWNNKIHIFNITGILTLSISIVGYLVISKRRVEDEQKRINLINKNFWILGYFFVFNILINLIAIIIFVYNSELSKGDESSSLKILLIFISSFMYCTFTFWVMGIFIMVLNTIKHDICKIKKRQDFKKVTEYIYIYWTYFMKYLFLKQPIFPIGALLFVSLTSISFVIRGSDELFAKHFIKSVAFYSFWISTAIFTIPPIVNGIRNLSSVYNQYSLHILSNSILPKLKNHVLIIGVGNLGKQIIRNCFTDIHPEGYGVESLCLENDDKVNSFIKEVSDYDIIIDKDLNILVVSRRVIVIDKETSIFKERFEDVGDLTIVTYEPWSDETIHMALVGIRGDAKNEYVLNAAVIDKADVIINATPDSDLSLYLASKYINKKLLLSVNDSYTFDSLIATTYDRSIYLIDTQSIEGILLAQLINHWAYKNIRANMEGIRKENINNNANSLQKLSMLSDKIGFDIKNRIENLTESENEVSEYDDIIREIKYRMTLKGNGRVLLVGEGSYIYHIIKSLILTLKFEMLISDEMIRNIINEKIFLLTDDERIKNEIVKKKGIEYWKFYPIRNSETRCEFPIEMRIFSGPYKNFEKFIDAFTAKVNNCHKFLPELILLINSKAYTSLDMFISASTATEVVNKSEGKKKYEPHILVYSNRADKSYLIENFKKYFTLNRKRIEKIGFPSQIPKESRLTKDWISASQYSSMIKALYNPRFYDKPSSNDHVAKIIFSDLDKPGAVAFIASSINGLTIDYDNPISFENKTIKVPSFINYYSREGLRYKDTFIFNGLAKLEEREEIHSINEIVKYCFINCKEEYRVQISKILKSKIGFEKQADTITEMQKKEFDAGMFSHYPISSILRHPDKYYDISYRRPRLFTFNLNPTKIKNETLKEKLNNYKNQPWEETQLLFNIAEFTIWAEGESKAGSLAEVLSEIILGRTVKNEPSIKLNEEPIIFYTRNTPTYESKVIEQKKNINRNIAQDCFYIKFRKKEEDFKVERGLIRAIKVKLSSAIIHKDLDWSNYLFNLIAHLKYNIYVEYSLFIIEKLYVEGLETEGLEGITEVSIYKKIIDRISIKDGGKPEFKIIRKWNYEDEKNYRELPEFSDDQLNDYFKMFDIQSKEYEFVIIRDDILNEARREYRQGHKYGTFLNMIYCIDDI